MALLDEGETDWKIIVIDVNDPLAPKLNDIEDVERHLPGLLRATNEWFRIYKIPDGKPENQFAFSGECKNRKYAMDVVRECAEAWEKLITGKTNRGDISLYVFDPLLKVIQSILTRFTVPTPPFLTPQTVLSQASSTSLRARTSPQPQLTHPLTSGSSSPVLPSRKLVVYERELTAWYIRNQGIKKSCNRYMTRTTRASLCAVL